MPSIAWCNSCVESPGMNFRNVVKYCISFKRPTAIRVWAFCSCIFSTSALLKLTTNYSESHERMIMSNLLLTFSTYPSTMLGSGCPGWCCCAAIRTADRAVELWMLFIRSFMLSLVWNDPVRDESEVFEVDSHGDRLVSAVRIAADDAPFIAWIFRGNVDAFCVVKFFCTVFGFSVGFLRWMLALTPGGAICLCERIRCTELNWVYVGIWIFFGNSTHLRWNHMERMACNEHNINIGWIFHEIGQRCIIITVDHCNVKASKKILF